MKLPENFDLASLTYTGAEPCIYWGRRGFGIRVYRHGNRKYVLSYRASGKKRLFTIASCATMSLDKAEDLAAAYRVQIDEGGDPVLEQRFSKSASKLAPKPQATAKKAVGDLCDTYLALHASKKRSGYSDERLIERFVRPAWGKLKAESVSRAQIAMLHTQVSARTPGQANRLLAVIKTMWKKAAIWGFIPEGRGNPAYGIAMNKETPRERFVTPSELPQLVSAIEKESDIRIRAALWLFLLTGARKGELLGARWDSIDMGRCELRIPRPKQGKPHIYPLSAPAMEVLKHMPRFAGNPYVIPGNKSGHHLVNVSKAWDRVRVRAGLKDVRLHDLRRSVGSWLAISGYSLPAIGKVLGHSSPRTTQIYARLTDDVARLALDRHSQMMMQVLQAADDSGRATL